MPNKDGTGPCGEFKNCEKNNNECRNNRRRKCKNRNNKDTNNIDNCKKRLRCRGNEY